MDLKDNLEGALTDKVTKAANTDTGFKAKGETEFDKLRKRVNYLSYGTVKKDKISSVYVPPH